jgi:hypothetical protein
LGRYSKALPYGFAGIFVVSSFFSNWYHHGIAYASMYLAKTILGAELIINENVHHAILNQGYGLWQFIEIMMSVYILVMLIKFLGKVQERLAGAQSRWGSYLFAIPVVFIIEIATVRFIDGHFGFIPLKDGIFFLMMNLTPVLNNIFPAYLNIF